MNAKVLFVLLLVIFDYSQLRSEDILTLSGKKFEGVTVKRADPDGLVFAHKDGVSKVPFVDLPEELRAKYNFDSEKAAQFKKSAQESKVKEYKAAQIEEAAKKKQVENAKNAVRINGAIFQVIPEGLIVIKGFSFGPSSSASSVGMGGSLPAGSAAEKGRPRDYDPKTQRDILLITGHSEKERKVEGDRIDVDAYEDGVFSYSDSQGSTHSIKRFQTTRTVK